jgi:hypothetical protein
VIAEKKKEARNRGKLRKKGINLQERKLREKRYFLKRKEKVRIKALS